MALPTETNFNPTTVKKWLKGHIWQRKSTNLHTKWEPHPHWKIMPHKTFISSPHRPTPPPQTSTKVVATISQQRKNLNTRHPEKPRYLVPPDLLQPSGYNMDQSNKCRVFLHLAGPHQQDHHKTPAPLSQYCPGSPPPTIPEHPVHQNNWGPYPATHSSSKNK